MHYSRLGVLEGLSTETYELEMNLDRFNKDIFKKCSYCQQVFAIKKNFERDKKICNVCVGLLEKEVKISPKCFGEIIQHAEYLQTFIAIMLNEFFIENQ